MPCDRLCAIRKQTYINGQYVYAALDCCTDSPTGTTILTPTPFTTLGCVCTGGMPTHCVSRPPCEELMPTMPWATATVVPTDEALQAGAPLIQKVDGDYPPFPEEPGATGVIGQARNFLVTNPAGDEVTIRLAVFLTIADSTHVAILPLGFQAEPDAEATPDGVTVVSERGKRCIDVKRNVDDLIFTVMLAEEWRDPAKAAPPVPSKQTPAAQ